MPRDPETAWDDTMIGQAERHGMPAAARPIDPVMTPRDVSRLIQSNQSAKSLDQVHAWIAQGEHRVGNPEEGATAQLGFDSPTPLHTIQSNQAKSLLREDVK